MYASILENNMYTYRDAKKRDYMNACKCGYIQIGRDIFT